MSYRSLSAGLRRCFLLSVFAGMLTPAVRANHYLGADITYEHLSGINYMITLTLYLDCAGSAIVPQSLSVVSDCGTSYVLDSLHASAGVEVSPVCPGELMNTTCNGGPLLGVRRYTIQQQLPLPGCSRWLFSWFICCRSTALNTAGTQGIYVESMLDNSGGVPDNSPVFGLNTVPRVCVNEPASVDLGVTDPDGDSLAFELIDGRYHSGVEPFPIEYTDGYTGAEPVPGIVLDPTTGHMSFTPTLIGNYYFVLKASAYSSTGHLKGSTMQDFVVAATACANTPPQATNDGVNNLTGATLVGPRDIGICQGSTVCFDAVFHDADAADVLQLTSDITGTLPGAQITVGGANPVTAHICWNTAAAPPGDHVMDITLNDGACPIVHTQQFAYHLRVGLQVDAGPDRTICSGEEVGLSASPGDVVWSSVSGDSLIVGENFSCDSCSDPFASPTSTTVYRAISSGGCADDVVVHVLPPTDPQCIGMGVAQHDAQPFTVRPNPSAGTLSITCPQGRSYEVLDVLGRVRWSGSWPSDGTRTLALPSQLANGQYLLRVRDADGATRMARFELMR